MWVKQCDKPSPTQHVLFGGIDKCSKVLHLGSSQGCELPILQRHDANSAACEVVGPGLALLEHSSLEVEVERLARTVNALDAKTYISSIAKGARNFANSLGFLVCLPQVGRSTPNQLAAVGKASGCYPPSPWSLHQSLGRHLPMSPTNIWSRWKPFHRCYHGHAPRFAMDGCFIIYIYIYCFTHINDYWSKYNDHQWPLMILTIDD